MWGGLLKTVLGFGGNIIGNWLERKKIKSDTKRLIELEKQKVITKQATADIDWDIEQAKNSSTSWKDEFFTIILSVPVMLAFVPGMAPYILEGFEVLRQVPEWFLISFGTAVAAAFGRSELTKFYMARGR